MVFNRKTIIIVIIVALALGFWGGFLLSNTNNPTVARQLINIGLGQPSEVDFSLFWDVYNDLQDKYVDGGELDQKKLLHGAISGMVNSVGDPYTVFFEPETSKKFQEEISGSFGGVGIEIGKRDDVLTVISPLKDTPGYRAGLKAGDKIIRVDGQSTADMSIEDAVNIIRGPRGSKVVLTIQNDTTRDVEIIRDTIKIPTVEWQMLNSLPSGEGKNIAYIQIFSFNQTVDSTFKVVAEEILKSNADSVIVDLRNNPGGLLDSSVNLAGWFLDRNSLVVLEEFGDGSKNEFRSNGNSSLKPYPTIVLINGGSASASEILAGALHDNRGIRLVGSETFGKGSVQQLQNYRDGSSLKVTIAKWMTPAGISISDTGIKPNVEVEVDIEDIREGIIEIGEPGKDPQLDRALELLR